MILLPILVRALAALPGLSGDDPITAWSSDVTIRPVSEMQDRHVIHAYFNHSPESPDGRWVLFYTSATPEGHTGEIRILERSTGKETLVAGNVTVEDAHRTACQQWVNGGKTIVYHNCRDRRWVVVAVEMATLKATIMASDYQIGIGSPTEKRVPIHGCHWNPGAHRDLDLVDVETGEIRTAVTMERVRQEYDAWLSGKFGPGETSIFFPVLSPDGKRAFFKIARGGGGDDFRSSKASLREGKIVYDLENGHFVRMYPQWGHPSWHPDSKRIFEKGNYLMDPDTGQTRRMVLTPSDHPSVSPDGRLFVTDADVSRRENAKPGDWAIVVGSMERNESALVHQFNSSQGAKSWRRSHPHPAFSPDGRRLYFNANSGPWTRLYVAEARRASSPK